MLDKPTDGIEQQLSGVQSGGLVSACGSCQTRNCCTLQYNRTETELTCILGSKSFAASLHLLVMV